MRSTRRLLTALAATALVLTACGDPADEATPTTAATTETTQAERELGDPAALVRGAAEATAEHESASSEMVVTVDGEEMMRIDGVFSSDGASGRAMTSTAGMEFEMMIVDGSYYYRYPVMPDGVEWIELGNADMIEATGMDPSAASGSPTEMLSLLESVADDVEELGTDELFGERVTGYRASISLEAMLEQGAAGGMYTDELAEQMRSTLPETYDIDVWIDEDGLPRRQEWAMTFSPMPGAPESTFEYRIDFTEWGASLDDLTAPSGDTVMSMQDFMAMAGEQS